MKRLLYILLLLSFLAPAHGFAIKQQMYLDVPLVAQGKLLCGPATIEMLFRYWGIEDYDQYNIALSMLVHFHESQRYQQSGIYHSSPIDWQLYPGTPVTTMRDFLQHFAETDQFMLEHEPVTEQEKISEWHKVFYRLKWYVSHGIPVIVHQYRKLPKSRGHYRLVTGYDENRKIVYLNDADGGRRIVQPYEEFQKLWNFDGRWLHYNATAFNVDRKRLNVKL